MSIVKDEVALLKSISNFSRIITTSPKTIDEDGCATWQWEDAYNFLADNGYLSHHQVHITESSNNIHYKIVTKGEYRKLIVYFDNFNRAKISTECNFADYKPIFFKPSRWKSCWDWLLEKING